MLYLVYENTTMIIIIHPFIIYLSKASKHIKRANQLKTWNVGLGAMAHVRLLYLLHVVRKNNTQIEMIYN